MAEFSKQWCEINDPRMSGDFDIMEIFETLEPNHYVNYICEGFGFLAIGNAGDNGCVLAMPVEGEEHGTVIWKKYDDVIQG